ncbi:nitrogen assimilation transcriptional regulator NAC [Neorhizobium sp. NCHU2750]|uniref:nitrogen assimilation transcriptional regulator NAC n=1 Tax=Neorhizobium sp. NCHU2750 TaxID=1825976 RepID=UPI000E752339|nr:LysR family transcriptional regulator [Neorhizobium sp. NCHU2750]
MDIRRLRSFITIVDMGSITRAADMLHIAQPALSQQLASLEEHFRQKLLTRSQQGVVLTDAGKVVYRHAQVILRQMEQAQAEALEAGANLSGRVSVGLAPFSSASTLALPLLSLAKVRYPGILLHITESVSQPYSQMIMNGRLEMALIHGVGPIRGVKFERLSREEFFLVAHSSFGIKPEVSAITVAELAPLPFILPPAYNFVRRAIDLAFTRSRTELTVVAELEAVKTIARAVDAGLGATIMPKAVAERIVAEASQEIVVRPINSPVIEETLSLCLSDSAPLSEPALAIRDLLLEVAATLQ